MINSRISTAISVFIFIFVSATLARATSFSIITPTENSTIQGNIVTVKFSLPENLHFSDSPAHSRPVYGEGHIHMWLDTGNFTAQSAIHVESDLYVIENVKYGPHTLTAEWVSNNDAHSQSSLTTSVSFTTSPTWATSKNNPIKSLNHTFFLISILAIVSLYLISRYSQAQVKTKAPHKKSKK